MVYRLFTYNASVFLHMFMLCEYSVRNKNQVTASGTSPVLCVCVCVHAHRCVNSCTCMLCKDSVRNKNPKSLQAVQSQSVCVHVCVCMCVCMCVCVRVHVCVHL